MNRIIIAICEESNTHPCIVEFTEVENILDAADASPGLLYGVITIVLILGVNGALISSIIKSKKYTLIDKFILLDCIICIGNVINIFEANILGEERSLGTCEFVTTFSYSWNLLNACLSMVIILYRAILILKSSWLETKHHKQVFGSLLTAVIVAEISFLTYHHHLSLESSFRFLGIDSLSMFASFYLFRVHGSA